MKHRIITGNAVECQSKLNEWEDEFKIDIIKMIIVDMIIIILLTLTPK